MSLSLPSPPSCSRYRGDVDFLHAHHGGERAFRFVATGSDCLDQHARRDLPGDAPPVLAPAARALLPAIADDSGLCVDALLGAPGVHSAYYGGAHKNDDDNNAKLLRTLAGVANRRAHYTAMIVTLRRADDPEPLIAHGQWHGEIVDAPLGDGGFGYDPYFYLPEFKMTAAQMPAAQRICERLNVDHGASRCVDQISSNLHRLQFARTN